MLTASDLGSTLNLTSQLREISRVLPCCSGQEVKSQRDKQQSKGTCSAQEMIQALGAAGLEEKGWPLLVSHSRDFFARHKSQKLHPKPPGKVGCFCPRFSRCSSSWCALFQLHRAHPCSTSWQKHFAMGNKLAYTPKAPSEASHLFIRTLQHRAGTPWCRIFG